MCELMCIYPKTYTHLVCQFILFFFRLLNKCMLAIKSIKRVYSIWLVITVFVSMYVVVLMQFDLISGSLIYTFEEPNRHLSDSCATKHYNVYQHNLWATLVGVHNNSMEYNIGGTLVLVSDLRSDWFFLLYASYIATVFIYIPALSVIFLQFIRFTYTTYEIRLFYIKVFLDQIIIWLALVMSIIYRPKYTAFVIGHLTNNSVLYDVTSDIHTSGAATSVLQMWLYSYQSLRLKHIARPVIS